MDDKEYRSQVARTLHRGEHSPSSLIASAQPPPLYFSPEKKGKDNLLSLQKSRALFFSLFPMDTPGSLEDSRGHWDTDTSVDYNTHVVCYEEVTSKEP